VLFSPVFVKRQHRPAPQPRSISPRFSRQPSFRDVETFKRSNVSPIYPFCPQTFTGSPTQRPQPNPFEINAFRTLFLATEGIPPLFPFRNSPPSLVTIDQAFLFMHLRKPILQPLSFQMRAGMGGYTLPRIRHSYVSTFRRRSYPVTGRVSRASQVQSGCWPPLCFFKVTDGHATKRGNSASRVPVSTFCQRISGSNSTREKRRMPSAVPGIRGVKF
jgi:hypothetical protein